MYEGVRIKPSSHENLLYISNYSEPLSDYRHHNTLYHIKIGNLYHVLSVV